MHRARLAHAVFLLLASAAAQSPIPIQPATPSELTQDWTALQSTPPTLTLIPHTPTAHPGQIWVRSTPKGLHLWGKIIADESTFRWPRQKSEVLAADHVEVWLAAEDTVPLPPIAWGNQFGPTELKSAADCVDQGAAFTTKAAGQRNCELWFAEQVAYRRALPHLFARQWLLSGAGFYQAHVFEDFATTADASLKTTLFREDQPTVLAPKPDDGVTAEFAAESRHEQARDAAGNAYDKGHQTGYTFHIVIPYSAFPPTRQLTLDHLSLMVDVFSAAPEGSRMGAFSTTSAQRVWGKPATFNHLHLLAPRAFTITPCQAKLQQADIYDDPHSAWFFPNASGNLTSTFALINPAEGYLYEPAGVSPTIQEAHFFSGQLAEGATICGPALAWQKGTTIHRTDFTLDGKSLATKPLPDGWTLVRSGPVTFTHNPFASGQCGACIIATLDVFAVSPTGDITPALQIEEDLSGQNDNPQAADLELAPDWSRITLFKEFVENDKPNAVPNWTSTTFCLAGHAYQSCAHTEKATPPKPARFPDLRQGED